MNYVWRDYNPNTTGYVEAWLDESAIQSTGLDDGFRDFYEYWANEVDFVVGENFWCKVVFENDTPFAVIAVCRHEQKTNIMEVVIAPRVCLKTGNVPSGARFFRQIRRFAAGILSYCKANQRNMTEKDPMLGYVIRFSNRL